MSFESQLREGRWTSRYFNPPASVFDVPTMLTAEEIRMLVWVSQHLDVDGDVCELGTFLGGSTVALAGGVAASKTPGRKIVSHDRFQSDAGLMDKFIPPDVRKMCTGIDIFPAWRHYTEACGDAVVPVAGDLLQQQWKRGAISLLFVDIAKTLELSDKVLTEFFPHLVPGSVVIQQDYQHHRTPYLVFVMHMLRHKIDLVSWTDEYSALFVVRDKITAVDIAPALSRNFTPERLIAAIDETLPLFPRWRQKEALLRNRKSIELAPHSTGAHGYPKVLAGI